MKKMLTKDFGFEVKQLDESGAFEGYAAVFNNVDFDNDKIIKGAFKRTIDHQKGVFPVLWQHKTDQPVGVNVEAKEDDYGLYVKGTLELTSNEGKRAHAWMKLALEKGLKVGLSIGYRVIKAAQDTANKSVRLLKEVQLYEYSIVTFPANELASVTEAKSEGDEMKGDKLFGTEAKALDFNAAFSKAQTEQELYRLKYNISDALYTALDSVCKDEDLTLDEKKSSVKTIYTQYAEAMSAWFSKWADFALADDGSEKNSGEELEYKDVKKGSRLSKATRKQLMDACDMHDTAIAMHQDAVKMLRKMCGSSKAEDESVTTPPEAAPATTNQPADSEVKELHSLLKNLNQKIVAK